MPSFTQSGYKHPQCIHYFVTFINEYFCCSWVHSFKLTWHFTLINLSSYTSAKWYSREKNRHLVETTRNLLLGANVVVLQKGDVILIVCYLINRMSFLLWTTKFHIPFCFRMNHCFRFLNSWLYVSCT